jgi:hypothetical protein
MGVKAATREGSEILVPARTCSEARLGRQRPAISAGIARAKGGTRPEDRTAQPEEEEVLDVGRQNAVDKVIGRGLLGRFDFCRCCLVCLIGRVASQSPVVYTGGTGSAEAPCSKLPHVAGKAASAPSGGMPFASQPLFS